MSHLRSPISQNESSQRNHLMWFIAEIQFFTLMISRNYLKGGGGHLTLPLGSLTDRASVRDIDGEYIVAMDDGCCILVCD